MQSELSRRDESIIVQLWYKFFPFWPLFLVLLVAAIIGAWFYILYQIPYYQASSSILIKDEKKGIDDSKITESLNYLSSKKSMENEIEVFKSKKLMREVVRGLNLYAPVYEEGKRKSQLLYATSPITVETKDPDLIEGVKKVYFDFDENRQKVIIDRAQYPLNAWVTTANGILRFLKKNGSYKAGKERLYFYLMNPKNAAENFLTRLNITPQGKLSSIVSLKLTDESPKRAEDILNKLIESYNEASVKEENSLASNTQAFVEARLNDVQNDLDKIESKIEQYKSNSGAIDISTQGRLFLQNVSSNAQKLSEINIQLAVLNQVENYVQSKDKSGEIAPSTLGVNDPTLTTLIDKLYTTELEYESLKKTTGDNNPLLVSVADQINKIKPSILENIRSQRRSLQASRNNLSGTNGGYAEMIQKIPKKERELLEISREQVIKTNIYNFLLQKREETALSNSKIVTDLTVVDAADASLTPVSPNKTIIYFSFILIALILSVSFIYAKETFSRTILFRDEIENRTSFPIIGEIAFEKSNNLVVIEDGKPGVIVEQFRKLRTSFHYLGIDSTTKKKILITSTISGEGKSFTALNLSLTLATEGKKVVIIEGDLRKPTIFKQLGLGENKGIANYLLDELELDDILKPTQYPNLSIIPAGPFQNNSSALYLNNKIENLLNKLDALFDFIIIDSAPAGLLSDAYILSPLCDATLYVVRHKYTSKLHLKTLEQNNKIHKLKNLAIVFNCIHSRGFTKNDYGYGYSYGYNDSSAGRISK